MRLPAAVQRTKNTQVVDMTGDVGQKLGDPLPCLAVLLEFPGRLQQLGRRTDVYFPALPKLSK